MLVSFPKLIAYTFCVFSLTNAWPEEESEKGSSESREEEHADSSLTLLASQNESISSESDCREGLNEDHRLLADSSHVFLMNRGDSIPLEHLEIDSDRYFEGYIQALVDMHFYEHPVVVSVRENTVYLYNLPKNEMLANSIISFVRDMPGVCEVRVMEGLSCEEIEEKKPYAREQCVDGVWFPQSTILFAPLVANPRQVINSAAWRAGDRVVGRKAIAVALGDDFPIFRWRNALPWCGDMQIGIEAGVWAVFNFDDIPQRRHEAYCELVNTDYYLGFPLTYAVDRWAYRLRLYHISSHIGDECLINHPHFYHKRANPSFEAVDLFASYQFSKNFRGYFGPGVILHSDRSFCMKTFYIEYGAELRILGKKINYHRLYGTPFLAIDIQNWQVRNWDCDVTVKAGYELSKLAGVGRKIRFFASYHHGFSEEGQFFLERTQYGEFGISWGF